MTLHTTPSARIRAKLDLAYPSFMAQAQHLWQRPHARAIYPVYLATMHMVVRSAVPLMQAAIDEARARGPDDALCMALADYYRRHLREESGHDTWLLEDLVATGTDPSPALDRMPPPSVAALVGAQYYWLRHHHPVALLGHIVALESYHPPAGFAQHLGELTGYPRHAFRAIARHEVLDVHHHRELVGLLDSLPLEAAHEKAIGLSALHTLEAGIDVLCEIHAAGVPREMPQAA